MKSLSPPTGRSGAVRPRSAQLRAHAAAERGGDAGARAPRLAPAHRRLPGGGAGQRGQGRRAQAAGSQLESGSRFYGNTPRDSCTFSSLFVMSVESLVFVVIHEEEVAFVLVAVELEARLAMSTEKF